MARFDVSDIELRLRQFERMHAKATGECLSSAEFFERYQAGDLDTPFGMKWATYCFALSRARGDAPNEASAPAIAL